MNPNLSDIITTVGNRPATGNLISNCAMAMINVNKKISFNFNDDEKSDLS